MTFLPGIGDRKTRTTAADTTPGFLSSKIVAGTNVSLAVLNPGADETLEVSATGGGGGAVDSVFTRTGAVVAAWGDYAASEVDNDSSVDGASVMEALQAVREQTYSDTTIDVGESRTVVAGQQMLYSGALDVLGDLDAIGDVTEVPSTADMSAAIAAAPPPAASEVTNDSTVPGADAAAALNFLQANPSLKGLTMVGPYSGGSHPIAAGECAIITGTNTTLVMPATPVANDRCAAIAPQTAGVSVIFDGNGHVVQENDGSAVSAITAAAPSPSAGAWYVEYQYDLPGDRWLIVSKVFLPEPAKSLKTTGSPVAVDGAAPPVAGQVLKAVSPTAATWQNASAGESLPYKVATDNQMEVGKTLKFISGTILFPTSPAPVDGDLCAAQSTNGALAFVTLDATGSIMRMSGNNYTTLAMRVAGYPYFRFRYLASSNAWNLEDSDAMYAQLAIDGFANANKLWLRGHSVSAPVLQLIGDGEFVGRPTGVSLGSVTRAQARSMLALNSQSLVAAPSITFDARLGCTARVTLNQVGHAFDFGLMTDLLPGMRGTITVVQGAGGETITSWTTFPAAQVKFPGGVPPVQSIGAGQRDVYDWSYDGVFIYVWTAGLAFA